MEHVEGKVDIHKVEVVDSEMKEIYLDKVDKNENELTQKIRSLNSVLESIKKDISTSQEEGEYKRIELREKANYLSTAKQSFKSLLSQSDTGILEKSEILEEQLEQFDTLLQKKKSAKAALFKVQSEITNTKVANKYLEIEKEIQHFGTNVTRDKEIYIRQKKEYLLSQILERQSTLETTIKRVKEQSRKTLRQHEEAGEGIRLASGSEDIGMY